MLDKTARGIGALCGSFLFLTTVTCFLRYLARYRQKVALQLDDALVAGALVYLSLDGLAVLTLGCTKLSALFFYRRIFCTTGTRDIFNMLTMVFITLASCWTVVFVVMTFNLCGHHGINWDVQPGNSAKCSLDFPYFEAVTISDFILDVLILGLPISKIWTLNANNRRKAAISTVFLLALVGLGASTARMVITIHLVVLGRPVDAEDAYQSNTQLAYYIVLEAGFTIVAVNLPSLWYFMAGITPKRVLHSVRSLVSIGSGRGSQDGTSIKGSKTSGTKATRDPRSLKSNSSHSPLVKKSSGTGVESYAMADLPAKTTTVDANGIQVDRNFNRTVEQV
ncbi:hypothetical protein G7Y89_g8416 [Cudoniella acicularis]|uniref:Rhodopsin domain-containing protein n=1 Tax=Cudoniella acicularis TaxID=354080 RepID=A0A8H4RGN3_9HELO|nr:hypothetical protein G7Y89_g8416 [Cudoniella acicularis]